MSSNMTAPEAISNTTAGIQPASNPSSPASQSGSTANSIATDRQKQILDAAERLIALYDDWSNDPHSPPYIEEGTLLDDAIRVLVDICETGDIPARCRELVTESLRLGIEYEKYLNGSFATHTREPLPSFYAAYKAFLLAREGAANPRRRKVESVRLLRDQKVGDSQIAMIYGAQQHPSGKWVGPFFDSRGNFDSSLIQREFDQPGSVIGSDFVHPMDEIDDQQRQRSISQRMNRLDAKTKEDKPRAWPEHKIVAYMKEGPNAVQVANVCGIPLSMVHEIASRHSLVLQGMEQSPLTQLPPSTASPQQSDVIESVVKKETEKAVRARIAELSSEGKTPPQIRKAINHEFNRQKSIQSITQAIREIDKTKRSQAANSTVPPSEVANASSDMDLSDLDLEDDENEASEVAAA